jgi:hypothetical protein
MSFELPSVQDAIIAITAIAGIAVLFAVAFISVSTLMSRGGRRGGGSKIVSATPEFAHPVATDSVPEFAHSVATDRIPELISR